MAALEFSMVGDPRGKGRPRAVARRIGTKVIASVYTDAKTKRYEGSVKSVARKAMGDRQPLDGPLSVSLRFRLAIPKSTPKYMRASYLSGESAYFGAFDIDNLVKGVMDLYGTDDGHVSALRVTKRWAE